MSEKDWEIVVSAGTRLEAVHGFYASYGDAVKALRKAGWGASIRRRTRHGRKHMQIKFKAKVQTMYDMDDAPLYDYIVVPTLTRNHVDMNAARRHPRYGAYANSDLFLGMLKRIRSELLNGGAYLRLDQLPDNVTVTPGFLRTVTIEVE